jgi:hypothetical protein
MVAAICRPAQQSIGDLHAGFLKLLPRVELHGRIIFRNVQCQHKKADAIAEMSALAWKWYVRLADRGKDASDFVVAFCRFLGYAVKSGRNLCGQEKAKDVLSSQAQKRHSFAVEKLPDHSTLKGNPLAEALRDNSITPPPDAAAFRIDFPTWLTTWNDRNRRIIRDMAMGERTLDLSKKYGFCPARISQKRDQFHQDWERFCAVPDEADQDVAA